MATDPRELILSRLVDVIAIAIGSDNVSRNDLYDDDATPTPRRVSVLEGDEIAVEGESARRAGAGRRIHMQPQVLLSNFDKADDVGAGLSEARAAIIKAIAADSQLIALTHNDTGGRYVGMESDLAFARDALGRMALKFQFTYALIPSEL